MPTTERFKPRAASFLSDTSGPSVTLMLAASVGTSVLAPDCGPLPKPANAIAEGRRRAGKDHSLSIFLLGGLLGFGNISTSGMATTITGEVFSSRGPGRETIRSYANLFFYGRH
jgi:hypothetical protein